MKDSIKDTAFVFCGCIAIIPPCVVRISRSFNTFNLPFAWIHLMRIIRNAARYSVGCQLSYTFILTDLRFFAKNLNSIAVVLLLMTSRSISY